MVAFGMSESGRSEQNGLRPRRPSFVDAVGLDLPIDETRAVSELASTDGSHASEGTSGVKPTVPLKVERLNPRKADALDEVRRTDVTVYADHVNVTAAPNQAAREMKPDFTLAADDPASQFVWMIIAVVGGVAIGAVAGVITGLLWFS